MTNTSWGWGWGLGGVKVQGIAGGAMSSARPEGVATFSMKQEGGAMLKQNNFQGGAQRQSDAHGDAVICSGVFCGAGRVGNCSSPTGSLPTSTTKIIP